MIEALEVIAKPENYPLVFHCNAGKDRSGILSAILLEVLGVRDIDIIQDYNLTDLYIKEFIARWNADPKTADVHKNLPDFQKQADAETMKLFLSTLKKEYGSAEGYLKSNGADANTGETTAKSAFSLIVNQLHHRDIQELPELFTHLFHHPDILKPQ